MKKSSLPLALLIAVMGAMAAYPSQDSPKPKEVANMTGLHDFDFLAGQWQVRHRRLKERLAGSQEWIEFDGTCTGFPLMGGRANADDNVLKMPGGEYRAVTLRSYDQETGQWAIWWLDGRFPSGPLEPPVKGRFENGVGTFHADDTLNGKPIRIRFIWSRITPTSAHWEQAFSPDGGKTWETNWEMEFRRVP